MLIVKILSFFAFVGSVSWLISKPDYDSALATVTSLVALIIVLIGEKKDHASQKQKVYDGGVGIQAGGDVNVGGVRSGKK